MKMSFRGQRRMRGVLFFLIKAGSLIHLLHWLNIGTASIIRTRWARKCCGEASVVVDAKHIPTHFTHLFNTMFRAQVAHSVSVCVSDLLPSLCSLTVALSLIACHVSRWLEAQLASGEDQSPAVPGWCSQAQPVLQLPAHCEGPAAVWHTRTCKLLSTLLCCCCLHKEQSHEDSVIACRSISQALFRVFFFFLENTYATIYLPITQFYKQERHSILFHLFIARYSDSEKLLPNQCPALRYVTTMVPAPHC